MALLCNDLPNVNADDNGTWRRIRVTPFESTFTDNKSMVNHDRNIYEMDKGLKEIKFDFWAVPFMGILMQEWIKYDKESIQIPKKVMAATKSYRNENNIIGQFIDACDVIDNIQGKKGMVAPTESENLSLSICFLV